jgi:hypothetical protein
MVEQINKQLAAEGKPPYQWKTIPQGAATSVWTAVVAAADEVGGRYCENCHVGRVVADNVTISVVSEGVRGYALDPNNAEALCNKIEHMVRTAGESRKDYRTHPQRPLTGDRWGCRLCGQVHEWRFGVGSRRRPDPGSVQQLGTPKLPSDPCVPLR